MIWASAPCMVQGLKPVTNYDLKARADTKRSNQVDLEKHTAQRRPQSLQTDGGLAQSPYFVLASASALRMAASWVS